jgi:acetolactate synthase-1/2/3 large subunit
MNNADLIIIMGARVGDRAMSSTERLEEKAVIVHIDIDPAEIGKNIEVDIPVAGDVKNVLEELLKVCKKVNFDDWHCKIASFKTKDEEERHYEVNERFVNPKYLLKLLSGMGAGKNGYDIIVTTEVGQNQIWAANHYKTEKSRSFISSGGMGTMGFGLPSAIGAKVGCPDCRVVCISGDGSFQMSMQELGTMKQNCIGVKVVIFNNSRLGMVRELQQKKYCRCSQVHLDENPDFISIVNAYGFKGQRISKSSEATAALEKMFEDDEPYILECIVNPDEPTL